MNEKIVTELINKIEKLPNETETTTVALIEEIGKNVSEFSNDDLFEIDNTLIKECKNRNITLDKSKHEGQIIGLPFHISFVIIKEDK